MGRDASKQGDAERGWGSGAETDTQELNGYIETRKSPKTKDGARFWRDSRSVGM